MKITKHLLAIAVFSFPAALPLSAAESKVLSDAGLSISEIKIPAPETPKNNQWATLSKITVNTAQPDMDNTLIGMVRHGQNIDTAVKELTDAGFKVTACQDNLGGYMVMADVTGLDAADNAVGLARYYYIEKVKVGQKVYDQLFGSNNKAMHPVRIGTVKGGMNQSPVDITINKLAWTITGGMNHSPVDIKIDNEAGTITGGANLSPVDLKFTWTPQEVTVDGGANQSPVNYTVNWEKGLLEGYSNNSPLRVEFPAATEAGTAEIKLTGYANRSPIDMTFNKVSGRLTGGMGASQVDVTLTNCDITDFLQYFFLFMKYPWN